MGTTQYYGDDSRPGSSIKPTQHGYSIQSGRDTNIQIIGVDSVNGGYTIEDSNDPVVLRRQIQNLQAEVDKYRPDRYMNPTVWNELGYIAVDRKTWEAVQSNKWIKNAWRTVVSPLVMMFLGSLLGMLPGLYGVAIGTELAGSVSVALILWKSARGDYDEQEND